MQNTNTERAYYIYTLIDPRDSQVRYVGCTVSPKTRLRSHISNDHNAMRTKLEWMAAMKSAGVVPVMHVMAVCQTIDEVRVKEKEVFDTYNYGQMLCADPSRMKYTARPSKYNQD